jgi:ABC-type nitrate/sulfonate/bicarbonate transport system permease component
MTAEGGSDAGGGARPAAGAEAQGRRSKRLALARREGGLGTALRLASYGSLLALWALAAGSLGDILPGPLETLAFVVREYERGALGRHLWITTQRVLIAFTLALVGGVAIGAAMGLIRRVDDLLQGWLITALTVPRILLFVVAYLILGLNDRALIVALVITVIPTVIVAIREGTRAIDGTLLEMARAFRRDRLTIWRHVVFPQLMPFVVGTARGSLALSWKMVVLGELLGRTSGVGYQISFYFQFFNMRGILAYGITMMALLAFIDLVVMGAIQRRVFRWRAPVKIGGVG